jgi:alcohol dehydrogenase class IV
VNDHRRYTADWNYPTAVKCGIGRIAELSAWCASLAIQRPLLITDPGLADLPMTRDAAASCGAAIFSGVKSNPTGQNVTDGVAAFKTGRHDGVVAFGGGSALDAAKAVALMARQKRPLWDFEDVEDNHLRVDVSGMAPLVAVPTTAGTGSEVGRASVITDEAATVKRIIFHARMLPSVVILDASLTTSLPAKLTAATGMDALSHNLEAYCSPRFHPMAAGIALEGMRLIREWLPLAVRHGDDLAARSEMLVASAMGATAFQRGLGAMHALAHPLGALHDAHHGLLNAILMPYVLQANRPAIEASIEAAASYLRLPRPSFSSFLDWVLALREDIGIPHTLSAIGIDVVDAQRVGDMALADPSHGGNPIAFDAAQYQAIFTAAVQGAL